MDNLLQSLPFSIEKDGLYYRLAIHKLKDKWLVSYESYKYPNQQIVWRHNKELIKALRMMMAWIVEHNYFIEDEMPVSLKQLSDESGLD